MVVLFQRTRFDLTNGLEKSFGARTEFWLSIANDLVTGQASGPDVVAVVFGGPEPDTLRIPYGDYLTRPVIGNLIEVTAQAGAFIEIIASEKKVDAIVTTIVLSGASAVPVVLLAKATGIGVVYDYIVPTGYRAYVWRVAVKNSGGVNQTANLRVLAPDTTTLTEPILSAVTVNAGTTNYYNTQQGNLLPAGGTPMGPGDDLRLGSSDVLSWSLEIFLVPL